MTRRKPSRHVVGISPVVILLEANPAEPSLQPIAGEARMDHSPSW